MSRGYRKVITGNGLIEARYFHRANRMFELFPEKGEARRSYRDFNIVIICKQDVEGTRKAIFIPTFEIPDLIFGLAYEDDTNNVKMFGAYFGTPELQPISGFFDLYEDMFEDSGIDTYSPHFLDAYFNYDRNQLSVLRWGQPGAVTGIYRTYYDNKASLFSAVSLPIDTSFTLQVEVDSGEYSNTFTQNSILNEEGYHDVSLTTYALADQVNAAFYAEPVVTSTLLAITPLLTLFGTVTAGADKVNVNNVYADYDGDEFWPPDSVWEYFDREARYSISSKSFVDKKVINYDPEYTPSQPRNFTAKVFPGKEHYVLDVTHDTYSRTNQLGFKKEIGKPTVWKKTLVAEGGQEGEEQYKLGEYKRLNNGFESPTSKIDLAALALGAGGHVVDSQLISFAHLIHFWQTFQHQENYALLVTDHRMYFTFIETTLYDRDFNLFYIFFSMRSDPDNIDPINYTEWQSRFDYDGGTNRHFWCGYIHDYTSRYSGYFDFRFGEEAGSPFFINVIPEIFLYVADENDDNNTTHGINNVNQILRLNLFELVGRLNPFTTPLDYDDVKFFEPKETMAFHYKGRIIVVLAETSYDSNKLKIPTGVYAWDFSKADADPEYAGEVIYAPDGINKRIRSFEVTQTGRYIYMLVEDLNDIDNDISAIDLDSGLLKTDQFYAKEGDPKQIKFWYPLVARVPASEE